MADADERCLRRLIGNFAMCVYTLRDQREHGIEE